MEFRFFSLDQEDRLVGMDPKGHPEILVYQEYMEQQAYLDPEDLSEIQDFPVNLVKMEKMERMG